ncbi:MAG: hypothetical protein OXC63_15810 [Aestuariivita sp.]|nr:hypothetical protein [Aestuariivita sp.]MCY4346823.1 hypothetical protein [Aestuariivita sp.]
MILWHASGGDVTPDTLAPFGIKTLILTESCVHLGKNRPLATMDLLFEEVLRLGKIMQVEDQAQELVENWKAELAVL